MPGLYAFSLKKTAVYADTHEKKKKIKEYNF